MKPIVVFRVPMSMNEFGGSFRSLMSTIGDIYDPDLKPGPKMMSREKKLHGYFVIILPTTEKDLSIQIFHEKDIKDGKVEELKKEVQDLINQFDKK